MHEKAALVSEVGWRGIRELSLSLLKDGLSVDVIIKGSVKKEILDIITRPRGLKIYAVPRRVFRIFLFFYFLWHRTLGDLKSIVVSKEQTGNWVKGFGLETKILTETEGGYKLE